MPMSALKIDRHLSDGGSEETLFEAIAADILDKGFSIKPDAVPFALSQGLLTHLGCMSDSHFKAAGIGRDSETQRNQFIRKDEIAWITGESQAGADWLCWIAKLQHYLNKRLLLGLFSFESHFSHYGPGDFYKRHYDAFKGEANRVLSMVLYLNSGWQLNDGGELVLYSDDRDQDGLKVTPLLGTLAVFLSEDFPHEVLPAHRDRYAIAGWFRVNGSTTTKVDPPR